MYIKLLHYPETENQVDNSPVHLLEADHIIWHQVVFCEDEEKGHSRDTVYENFKTVGVWIPYEFPKNQGRYIEVYRNDVHVKSVFLPEAAGAFIMNDKGDTIERI